MGYIHYVLAKAGQRKGLLLMLSEFRGKMSVGHSCLFSVRFCFSPCLSDQPFLVSSCVLISMGGHPTLLINTHPVND